MVKYFFLNFKDSDIDFSKIKHIEYNVHKKINTLKDARCNRIDLFFECSQSIDQKIIVEWNDIKTARVVSFLPENIFIRLTTADSIPFVYENIFSCLKTLWSSNGWDEAHLAEKYEEIRRENFVASFSLGKRLSSPDKRHKVEFFFEVFPEYANYYLNFLNKANSVIQQVNFLKGTPLVHLFLTFFPNHYWRDNEHFFVTDINKEIFYIFNLHSGTHMIEYKPIYNSLEQCKNYVRAFEFDVSQQERLMLLGLPPVK